MHSPPATRIARASTAFQRAWCATGPASALEMGRRAPDGARVDTPSTDLWLMKTSAHASQTNDREAPTDESIRNGFPSTVERSTKTSPARKMTLPRESRRARPMPMEPRRGDDCARSPSPQSAHAAKGAFQDEKAGRTKGRTTAPNCQSKPNSPRDGKSAMLALEGTHSNQTETPAPSRKAAKDCSSYAASGAAEYPLTSAAIALLLSIQWMTRRPRSSSPNEVYGVMAARSSS